MFTHVTQQLGQAFVAGMVLRLSGHVTTVQQSLQC